MTKTKPEAAESILSVVVDAYFARQTLGLHFLFTFHSLLVYITFMQISCPWVYSSYFRQADQFMSQPYTHEIYLVIKFYVFIDVFSFHKTIVKWAQLQGQICSALYHQALSFYPNAFIISII